MGTIKISKDSARGLGTRDDAFAMAVGSCLGLGRCPVAPGTVGSLFGIGVYVVYRVQPDGLYLLSVMALAALAVWASGRIERVVGREDPSILVIDEVVGLLVAFAWLPSRPTVMVSGFLLFRAFDMVKPPPIRWVERRMPGGLGIVGDDVIAGIYANIGLRFLMHFVDII